MSCRLPFNVTNRIARTIKQRCSFYALTKFTKNGTYNIKTGRP